MKVLKTLCSCLYIFVKYIEYVIAWLFKRFYGLYPKKVDTMKLVYVLPNGIVIKGNDMSIVIRNDQKVSFALAFEDKFGNAVTDLGSVPAWSLSDEGFAELSVSEDGLSAVVTPLGPKGSVLVNVVVDADPDEAYEELVGQAEIAILSGKATVIRMAGVISDVTAVEAPVETPVETPAEPETPEVPAEPETPVETPAEPEAPTEETPAGEAPVETPAAETPAETPVETPAEEQPAETEVPAADTGAEEAPKAE